MGGGTMTYLEKQQRIRDMYGRLNTVVSSFKFPRGYFYAPQFIDQWWQEWDRLDALCFSYLSGGAMDWEVDILAQSKHCFNLLHEWMANEIR